MRPRSLLDYMYAMVPSGTCLSVCDDSSFPPPRSPLAATSVAFIVTFMQLLAGLSLLAPTAPMFADGLHGITSISGRDQEGSTSGPTNTESIIRFSEKTGNQGKPLC